MPRLLAKLADDHGERLPVDELHGVKMHAAFGTDRVNRDDVRVVQLGGGLGLVLEALQVLGVESGRERQHFQGDAPIQRQLDRLVNDPHATPADLAHDPVIAQRFGRWQLRGFGGRARRMLRERLVLARGLMDQFQSVQAASQRFGDVGMTTEEILPIGSVPRF